jgi:serine/threonine protein kinase
MELVEGPSLRDKIKDRPLKVKEALRIAGEVAEGLSAAHEKVILHRDIKSGNILLTPEGQAKITDFGLVTLADHTRLTRTGAALGTPGYTAPEQARGERSVWFWANDWSPDGRSLAGTLQHEAGNSMGLANYSFETKRSERLTETGMLPRWLNGSRRLLFAAGGKIHILDTRTSKTHVVLAVEGWDIDPYFDLSRDSRAIYFGLPMIESDIWLMRVE